MQGKRQEGKRGECFETAQAEDDYSLHTSPLISFSSMRKVKVLCGMSLDANENNIERAFYSF